METWTVQRYFIEYTNDLYFILAYISRPFYVIHQLPRKKVKNIYFWFNSIFIFNEEHIRLTFKYIIYAEIKDHYLKYKSAILKRNSIIKIKPRTSRTREILNFTGGNN